jgi:hypothetical protein
MGDVVINPSNLVKGTRYAWGAWATGRFIGYLLLPGKTKDGVLWAAFTDLAGAVLESTSEGENVVRVSDLRVAGIRVASAQ